MGAMNHPQLPAEAEIREVAELGFDFIDLTMEPPAAGFWQIDIPAVKRLLQELRLGIVGHTAPYLPLGHLFSGVRRAAVDAFIRCAEVFAELGADRMNIHPDRHAPMHDRKFLVEANLESLSRILDASRRLGVTVMIENFPGAFNTAEEMGELLGPLPDLGLHLDIGHTHLHQGKNPLPDILDAWGHRLKHVHIHDNFGSADLHLPLGAGNVDVAGAVAALKGVGYDGTVTLEVYSKDRSLLVHSMEKLRRMWG